MTAKPKIKNQSKNEKNRSDKPGIEGAHSELEEGKH